MPGSTGYAFIHNAVDNHSRLAYSEILTDEKKEAAVGFWLHSFAGCGITVKRVLTDNGSCSRSHTFADALGEDIKRKRTRPCRPQTDDKVERFNRTMLEEWAYVQPYDPGTERLEAFDVWLHGYNHDRRSHSTVQPQATASLTSQVKTPN